MTCQSVSLKLHWIDVSWNSLPCWNTTCCLSCYHKMQHPIYSSRARNIIPIIKQCKTRCDLCVVLKSRCHKHILFRIYNLGLFHILLCNLINIFSRCIEHYIWCMVSHLQYFLQTIKRLYFCRYSTWLNHLVYRICRKIYSSPYEHSLS